MTDAEPTGHTIDGTPWEEPRPPHLPDPVVDVSRRVPIVSWAFLAVAAVLAAWSLRGIMDVAMTPTSVASLAIGLVHVTAPALFGAALFVRHPRAYTSDPRMVFGIVLLVIAQIWPILESPFGDALVNSDPDAFGPSPLGIGLSLLGGLLQVFGVTYVARGLLDARANRDADGARTRLLVPLGIAVVAILTSLALIAISIRRGEFDTSSPTVLVANIVAELVQSLLLLAWAYVVATAWNGAVASERPTVAWRAAAAGSALVLASTLLIISLRVVFTLLRPTDDSFGGLLNISFWVISIVSTLGYLALIAAFAAGLPGVDGVLDDGDDEEGGEEEEVGEEAGGGSACGDG